MEKFLEAISATKHIYGDSRIYGEVERIFIEHNNIRDICDFLSKKKGNIIGRKIGNILFNAYMDGDERTMDIGKNILRSFETIHNKYEKFNRLE